ncbi:MAG: sensor domain-containing diguanylate cyclase [Erysipelotrichaceae bacterium]
MQTNGKPLMFIEQIRQDRKSFEAFRSYMHTNTRNPNPKIFTEIRKVQSLCTALHYQEEAAWCAFYLGWLYHEQADYSLAVHHHTIAHNTFYELDAKDGLPYSHNALLADYLMLGIYDLAIEHGTLGIKIAEQTGATDRLLVLLFNTGHAYLFDQKNKQAAEIFESVRSYPYAQSQHFKATVDITYAQALNALGDCDAALALCDKTYKTIQVLDDAILTHEAHYVYGEIYREMKQYDTAIASFTKAYHTALAINNHHKAGFALLGWVRCAAIQKDLEAVTQLLEKAFTIAKQLELPLFYSYYYRAAMEAWASTQEFEQAYLASTQVLHYQALHKETTSNLWVSNLKDAIEVTEAASYRQMYDEIQLITEIGQRFTRHASTNERLITIYNEINQILPIDSFSIAQIKDGTHLDYALSIRNGQPEAKPPVAIDSPYSLGAYSYRNRANVLIQDLTQEYQNYITTPPGITDGFASYTKSIIMCPLLIDDTCLGILSIQSYQAHAYTEKELRIIKLLSSYIAIALENHTLFQSVAYLASHDALTKIDNRSEILRKASLIFQRAEADHAVLMLDVDHFKLVNDTYGHLIGDEVLLHIVTTLKSQLRTCDHIGRFGGEEFLIILEDVKTEDVHAICERIRAAVHLSPYQTAEHLIPLSVSVGVYYQEQSNLSFQEQLRLADNALYRAKNLGRDRVIFETNTIHYS